MSTYTVWRLFPILVIYIIYIYIYIFLPFLWHKLIHKKRQHAGGSSTVKNTKRTFNTMVKLPKMKRTTRWCCLPFHHSTRRWRCSVEHRRHLNQVLCSKEIWSRMTTTITRPLLSHFNTPAPIDESTVQRSSLIILKCSQSVETLLLLLMWRKRGRFVQKRVLTPTDPDDSHTRGHVQAYTYILTKCVSSSSWLNQIILFSLWIPLEFCVASQYTAAVHEKHSKIDNTKCSCEAKCPLVAGFRRGHWSWPKICTSRWDTN